MTSATTARVNRAENALWYGVAVLAVAALAGLIVLVILIVKGAGVSRLPVVDAPPPALVPAPMNPLPGQGPGAPAAPGAPSVPVAPGAVTPGPASLPPAPPAAPARPGAPR